MQQFFDALKLFTNRRLLTIFLLGFSSGLPLLLTSSTLQAWYSVGSSVNVVAIGWLALIGLPYTWKFLWSPFMDRFVPPLLGRRRGWMLITQMGLFFTIALMAFIDPKSAPLLLAIVAFIVAFISSSQDIAINAYQTDVLKPEERGPGASMYTGGYRIAMLISGGLALIIAGDAGWRLTYLSMAALMIMGVLGTLLAPKPPYDAMPPTTLKAAVFEPFKEFLTRKQAIAILVFIILYKLSYAFTQTMTPTFLLKDLAFSLEVTGAVNKGLGLSATIVGVFLGGLLTAYYGLYRCLLGFGLVQALGNLAYMALAFIGKNYTLMVIAITQENFFAGLETAAIVAFIMSLCDHRFTATQFALLSAFAAYGRVLVGPFAGEIVAHLGWANFYFWAAIVAIPGLLLLLGLRKTIPTIGGGGQEQALA